MIIDIGRTVTIMLRIRKLYIHVRLLSRLLLRPDSILFFLCFPAVLLLPLRSNLSAWCPKIRYSSNGP